MLTKTGFSRVMAAFMVVFALSACGSSSNAHAASKAQSVGFLLSQVRNASGSLAGGKVYFYEAGTSTLKNVWLDRGKQTPAANPYTLDSNGTAAVFCDGIYRIVIKTSALVTVYDRDNISIRDVANNVYDVADYASLAAAVASIGSTPATLQFAADVTVSANLVIPSTLELMPLNGAKIQHTIYNITVNSSTIRWPLAQIFDGTGTITLGSGTTEVFAEWWGASNVDSVVGAIQTATTAAFNSAIRSAARAKLKLANGGVYPINGPIASAATYWDIEGAGIGAQSGGYSEIKNYNATLGHAIWIGDTSEPYPDAVTDNGSHLNGGYSIKNVFIRGNANSGNGIRVYNATVHLENVGLYQNGGGGGYFNKAWASTVQNVMAQANGNFGQKWHNYNTKVMIANCGFISLPQATGLWISGGGGTSSAFTLTNNDYEGNTSAGLYFDTSTGGIQGVTSIGGNWEGNSPGAYAVLQSATGVLDNLVMITPNFADANEDIALTNARYARMVSPTFAGCDISTTAGDMTITNPNWGGVSPALSGKIVVDEFAAGVPTATYPNGSIVRTPGSPRSMWIRTGGAWRTVPTVAATSQNVTGTGAKTATFNVDQVSQAEVVCTDSGAKTITVVLADAGGTTNAYTPGDTLGVMVGNPGGSTGTVVVSILDSGVNVAKHLTINVPATNKVTVIKFTKRSDGYWFQSSDATDIPL